MKEHISPRSLLPRISSMVLSLVIDISKEYFGVYRTRKILLEDCSELLG